jgi:nucleoside-diphosphate-sugar epimerase
MRILITGGSGFIGTNLVQRLFSREEYIIKNVDLFEPKVEEHLKYWKKINLLDKRSLMEIFEEFKPQLVVHLAARTDTDPANNLDHYRVNFEGSQNLIDCIKATKEVIRVVFTSTQFVNQYNGEPKNDEDFAPHTVYGESKVLMEKMIRSSNLTCEWSIIRPTNIWGPWHLRYPFEFWSVLSKGLYFHPGKQPVIRSYGYVGNVVEQIVAILNADREKIDGQVFYVGDYAIDLYDWVNGFSVGQTGKNVRVIPRWIVRTVALVGDVLAVARIKFPLTSSRYRSMTTSNSASMKKTFDALGPSPFTLEDGINETLQWLKVNHPNLLTKK